QTISAGSGTIKYDSSTWWVANLAKRIAQGGGSVYSEFWYGAGRERIRQFAQKSASTSEATTYVGGLYEKFTRTVSGTPATEHVHYVRGAGPAVAIVKRAAGTLQTRYLHRDHLGSVVALTDASGAVLERYSYDPWGKRRDAATWASPAPGTFPIDPAYSDRGYTGHEHIDHVGLVNMNGRIYDAEIGRFLSADPTTQFPESTQGWNRYSYCGNNPLSYTDPSGFSFWKSILKVVGIVMSVFAPQFTMLWQQMLWSFASGYLSSGGNLQGGLMAMAFVGLGRWSAGLNPAGAPAGTLGGTPGINPTGGFSFTAAEAAEVAGTTAERSMTDKIAEVVYRSIRAFSPNDAGSRTNSSSRVNAQASDTATTSISYATASPDVWPGLLPAVRTVGTWWATVAATVLSIPGDTTREENRLYVTYTRQHRTTGQIYVGRTSGVGDPETLAANRARGQPHLTSEGFAPPRIDRYSRNRDAIRGREQMVIDYYGGARSVGGPTRNEINGVWDFNPNRPRYMEAARREFGYLQDNSPPRPRLEVYP
ncbi:MAG: RHS repeat-associated core domain-containing protein, partial [Steroidobacteraceae bacterium]